MIAGKLGSATDDLFVGCSICTFYSRIRVTFYGMTSFGNQIELRHSDEIIILYHFIIISYYLREIQDHRSSPP